MRSVTVSSGAPPSTAARAVYGIPAIRSAVSAGSGGAESPDGRAERLDLFQVELHQTFLAGRRETGAPISASRC